MKDIIIFGAGGFAREVAFVIKEINRITPAWRILGFAEADDRNVGKSVGAYTVYCSEEDVHEMEVDAVIAVGNPEILRKIAGNFREQKKVSFPNVVHPNTVYDKERIVMGEGNIVCAGVYFTTDIQIGNFNHFNLSTTIGHDVVIGDYCIINPGVNISGGVTFGNRCNIGTGASILQNISIGDRVTVGAGAVVTRDIEDGVTAVGVPAKPL
ncbi:MAG: acetyltransferase [Deltaproteobacteria bacterium]|uniref:Acetyltransferase n=1 Tax=Candidatus Zymogenus saltonus TaxID=2844893 RepID=A0A9D8PLK3_9DELT|nr:acetyltransferase [Candidatus Zymogenus saltonus]